MNKRFIALFIIFTMLVSISPSVAANDTVPRLTVEEILNEYHQKAFEAEAVSEASAASYFPRSGSNRKTLEQETVDTLNAAGYEAYNVTSDNYATLEAQLQTDFADMGLDPDGSYIITIGGENLETAPANNGSRAIVPTPDWGDSDGSFLYNYNGNNYSLRYVTVTPDMNPSKMQVQSSYIFREQNFIQSIGRNIFNTAIASTVDSTAPYGLPLGTIASILFDIPDDYIYTNINLDDIELRAHTVWTYNYIQVWDKYHSTWVTSQLSEYATSGIWRIDSIYDPATGRPIPVPPNPQYSTHHSYIYFNEAQRCLAAMKAYDHSTLSVDCVYSVDFYFSNESGDVIFNSTSQPLFTHYRGPSLTLPDTN